MATKQPKKIRVDGGYLNAFMPGGRNMNYSAQMMSGGYLLDQRVLQSSYIHNGFARTICDVPAEEMTRAGFTIEGDSVTEQMKAAMQAKLEELDAVRHLNEAIKWRRAFGGALIILGLKDGLDLTEPLDEDRLQDIEFMRTYDRYEAWPHKRYDDPKLSNFGNVELWSITPKHGGSTYYVHESRVLVFDGESLPNDIRNANDGWGASVIQSAFIQLNRLDHSYKYGNLLLERMQQAVHSIEGLSEMLEEVGGEARVAKRVHIVDTVRGALNTIVIDGKETYEIKGLTLTGVDAVIDRNAEALSAVTRIPVYVLMTRSPGGLNATGATNQDAWFAQIESWQNDLMRKPVDRLVSLLRRVDSDGETDGGDYTLTFNPLSTPSELQQAEIDLKNNQATKALVEALSASVLGGAMDENEMRQQLPEEWELEGDAPEPVEETPAPMVLNPGQKIVDPTPGQSNPSPVGTK